jgi:hypothetical protein
VSETLTVEAPTAETPPLPSPEDDRSALRAAIAAKAAVTDKVDKVASAIRRAEEAVRAADSEVERAEAGVVTAKQKDADAAASAALKGKPAKQATARQARNDLVDARDTADVARDALLRLREQLAQAQHELFVADAHVLIARARVISPFVKELSARFIALNSENIHGRRDAKCRVCCRRSA